MAHSPTRVEDSTPRICTTCSIFAQMKNLFDQSSRQKKEKRSWITATGLEIFQTSFQFDWTQDGRISSTDPIMTKFTLQLAFLYVQSIWFFLYRYFSPGHGKWLSLIHNSIGFKMTLNIVYQTPRKSAQHAHTEHTAHTQSVSSYGCVCIG